MTRIGSFYMIRNFVFTMNAYTDLEEDPFLNRTYNGPIRMEFDRVCLNRKKILQLLLNSNVRQKNCEN